MRAVVLVGGFGTRLRPLTYTKPKPMLPVGHLPIIERLIAGLVRGGVDDVTLALGFKPEPFRHAFPDGTCHGARLHYAVEPEPLDTAGAIRFAAEFAGIDDTFVVANGDVLTDLDIVQLVDRHRQLKAQATIHLIAVDDPSAFGVVEIDDDARIHRFVEKPAPGTAPSNLINAGTYVLEASVLDLIPAGQKVSIERATFPIIAADGRMVGLATDDYWIDTGRPELYLQANLDLLSGRRRHDRAIGVDVGALVDAQATVTDSVVANGTTIGPQARVARSVILEGATVGDGAVVNDSVVMGTVGRGAVLDQVVLGADGVIEAGEIVRGQRRPEP